MGIDIKNFYLNTPMPNYKYMHLHISLIPEEVIKEYNLLPLVHNGYVYMEILKGRYGLPQAGILVYNLLKERLTIHGYHPCTHTPGLWWHTVVDDFGVQYMGIDNALHLIKVLKEHYTISLNWKGTLYCGITLQWDYLNRTVNLSMHSHDTPQIPASAS